MPVQLNEQFEVQGDELTMQQAEAIKVAGYALLEQSEQSPVRIDFARLERANSVTVAVMVAWHRRAALQKKAVEFTNLSAELGNIIEFSGLRELLLADHSAQL